MVVTNRYHKVMVGWVEFAGGRLQVGEVVETKLEEIRTPLRLLSVPPIIAV